MARKTVEISKLIDRVNHHNAFTADAKKAEREALNFFLETILLDAGVYKGFNYLRADGLDPRGEATSVGINVDETGTPLGDITARFANTDATRVKYYKHRSLYGPMIN